MKMDESLWEEVVKLVFDLLKRKERALAWCKAEKGRFQEEYFPPVVMPIIKHVPWVQHNFLIPPSLFNQIVNIIQDKIALGVYKPSVRLAR